MLRPRSEPVVPDEGVIKALSFSPAASRSSAGMSDEEPPHKSQPHASAPSGAEMRRGEGRNSSLLPAPGRISKDERGVEVELLERQLSKAEAATGE